ncbi:hypothetical protein CTEN210_18361 [Chaetoceros tenuissimus]|uniref:Uncharacterized protein n=1 Tax=Chaetoceros tenuissimus TaxID=426638 RepID=A0AAD3DF61_9STRA|nr:hypothetical protein CTEN210_18361 [Chaetoceros tenuissimus]
MKFRTRLSDEEWEEIEKLGPGVRLYNGLKTLFYNGETLWSTGRFNVYDKDERESWEQIIVLPGVEVIPNFTFFDCKRVKIVLMNDSVKRLEFHACRDCKELVFILFWKNLEYIGNNALSDCKSLFSLFVPEACKEIRDYALKGCKSLTILSVPRSSRLGGYVIKDTALFDYSPFANESNSYDDNEEINEWILNRHNDYPLHRICCSENTSFTSSTVIPNEGNCFVQDDCNLTALHYLIVNHTADYGAIEDLATMGGKELLLLKDKKDRTAFNYACMVGDLALLKIFVIIGGRDLESEEKMLEYMSKESMESALLIHDYIRAINLGDEGANIDEAITKLLESNPTYDEINRIMKNENVPDHHLRQLKEYISDLLQEHVKAFTERQEKMPLMRSKITVVGRGRDGKTSTINSLKGLPFSSQHKSTKGSQTSEVAIFDIGIHVTRVDANATGVAFQEAERDQYSTLRSLSTHLIEGNKERRYYDDPKENFESKLSTDDNETTSTLDSITDLSIRFKQQSLDIAEPKNQSPRPHKEEEEVAQKIKDMDLMNKDGKSIRFTIYDNGGQRVFRCIQNLLLSREGIFVVVFDIMKLLDKDSQEDALEHLKYWLSSIKFDALKEDSDEFTDPSIKYPPVILVGTHYDEFLKYRGEKDDGLVIIHELLKRNLPLAGLIHLPYSPEGNSDTRCNLYNKAQDLCFWPIDNSNPTDSNILALRQLLLDTAINDRGFDIAQRVPISMLKAMDKLTEISLDQPIIPITNSTEDEDTLSVMQVMTDCGVFEGESFDTNSSVEICRELLKQYHRIGHFLYFHQVPTLQEYCILDPQWLINMITYIVRDFRYHWFLRDRGAIELNNGKSWRRLKDEGILEMPLLRQLWIGNHEYLDFLSDLLVEIGIFGDCGNYFTVPIVLTSVSESAFATTKKDMSNYFEALQVVGHLDVKKHGFAMLPFYCRLVNALVSDDCPPILMSSACIFILGQGDHMYSLLLDQPAKKIFIFSTKPDMLEEPIELIKCECSNLNSSIYNNRLEIVLSMTNEEDIIVISNNIKVLRPLYRNKAKKPSLQSASKFDESMKNDRLFKIRYNDLLSHFNKTFSTKRSEEIVKCILETDGDISISSLRNFYYEDEVEFKDSILPELGVAKILDKKRVIAALQTLGKPPNPTNYMVACIEDDSELKREQDIIRYKLAWSNLQANFVEGEENFENISNLFLLSDTYKVLHFCAHSKSLEATKVRAVLRDDSCKSQIKCIVFNSCHSEDVLSIAKKEFPNASIIYWDSKADNEAALRFAEEFYGRLCSQREQSTLFREAFNKTIFMMKEHNFKFADPDTTKDLVAGVLKFWGNSIATDVEMHDKDIISEISSQDSTRNDETASKKRRRNDDPRKMPAREDKPTSIDKGTIGATIDFEEYQTDQFVFEQRQVIKGKNQRVH